MVLTSVVTFEVVLVGFSGPVTTSVFDSLFNPFHDSYEETFDLNSKTLEFYPY